MRFCDKTMTFKRCREESESGKSPEKLLSLRYKLLRLGKPEKSGKLPEILLPLKLKTRSWSNWFRILESSEPVRFRYSKTSFETLPLMHSLTPCQLQRSGGFDHLRVLSGSNEDLSERSACVSVDLTKWVE